VGTKRRKATRAHAVFPVQTRQRGHGATRLCPQPQTVEAIQRLLEKAGVEFTNGNKPGVRLKEKSRRENETSFKRNNFVPS
jgi:hypothetical protein